MNDDDEVIEVALPDEFVRELLDAGYTEDQIRRAVVASIGREDVQDRITGLLMRDGLPDRAWPEY